jgi:protein gp37
MAQATNIGWTDVTWNPVHGCSIVSTECRNCYAATLSLRYGQTSKPWTPANAGENVTLKPHKLREPLSGGAQWRGVGDAAAAAGKVDGMLVFVNSMSDLFHELVPPSFVAEVFATMILAERHTFQVLTKRPKIMHALLTDPRFWWEVAQALLRRGESPERARALEIAAADGEVWARNVWLGVSVGQRQFAERLDYLRATPAEVRFASCEPLLGSLVGGDAARGVNLGGLDWVIVGGESGARCRPMQLRWAREVRDECWGDAAFFMKQLGGARPGTPMSELPEDLRLREFPAHFWGRQEVAA